MQAIIICPKNELTTFPILKGYLEFLRSRGREKDVARIEQVFSDRVPKGD